MKKMDHKSIYQERLKNPRIIKLRAEERLILEITEKIIELMHEKNITKAELAERLCKSKKFVTKLLNGSINFTVRTIADIFHVLDEIRDF